MPNYQVRQGDCIESIASRFGFRWEAIWNHPGNAELKTKRKDPNVLKPEDVVFIPDKTLRQESCPTDQRHTFCLLGAPCKLVLVLTDQGIPRSSQPYILEVDGTVWTGTTDSSGRIEHPISPRAKRGKLLFGPFGAQERYDLKLGHVDPISEPSGVRDRLRNLGLASVHGQPGAETDQAVADFQEKYGLNVTGKLDETTRKKLQKVHGC
jgi:hypothetical protein